jgi:hypothetical protein
MAASNRVQATNLMQATRKPMGKKTRAITRVAAIMCLLLATEAGCRHSGAVTFPISGTVSYNGKPLPDGAIVFLPESGPSAADAGAIHDGRFAFSAHAGKKKVEIRATREVGPVNRTMGARDKQSYIPAQYNSQTTLTAEVVPDGSKQFVFDLRGPP